MFKQWFDKWKAIFNAYPQNCDVLFQSMMWGKGEQFIQTGYRAVIGVLRKGDKQTILVGSFMFQVPSCIWCIRRFLRSFLVSVTKKVFFERLAFFGKLIPGLDDCELFKLNKQTAVWQVLWPWQMWSLYHEMWRMTSYIDGRWQIWKAIWQMDVSSTRRPS